jgi:hypothetical protein
MQTFLPFPDVSLSLHTLDFKRLGKQRVEASQIMDILVFDEDSAWKNHPAVKMWEGYEEALIHYYNESLRIFEHYGGTNNKLEPYEEMQFSDMEFPWWWGNEAFHLSHLLNLYRKAPEIYYTYMTQQASELANEHHPTGFTYIWPGGKRDRVFHVVSPSWAKKSKSEYVAILDPKVPTIIRDHKVHSELGNEILL